MSNLIVWMQEVKDGKLTFAKSLSNGVYEITIEKVKNKASRKQQKYHWGVVIPKIQEFFSCKGEDISKDEANLRFKDMAGLFEYRDYLDVSASFKFGQDILITGKCYKSFSELKTIDYMNALEIVIEAVRIVSKDTIIIPFPPDNTEYKNLI